MAFSPSLARGGGRYDVPKSTARIISVGTPENPQCVAELPDTQGNDCRGWAMRRHETLSNLYLSSTLIALVLLIVALASPGWFTSDDNSLLISPLDTHGIMRTILHTTLIIGFQVDVTYCVIEGPNKGSCNNILNEFRYFDDVRNHENLKWSTVFGGLFEEDARWVMGPAVFSTLAAALLVTATGLSFMLSLVKFVNALGQGTEDYPGLVEQTLPNFTVRYGSFIFVSAGFFLCTSCILIFFITPPLFTRTMITDQGKTQERRDRDRRTKEYAHFGIDETSLDTVLPFDPGQTVISKGKYVDNAPAPKLPPSTRRKAGWTKGIIELPNLTPWEIQIEQDLAVGLAKSPGIDPAGEGHESTRKLRRSSMPEMPEIRRMTGRTVSLLEKPRKPPRRSSVPTNVADYKRDPEREAAAADLGRRQSVALPGKVVSVDGSRRGSVPTNVADSKSDPEGEAAKVLMRRRQSVALPGAAPADGSRRGSVPNNVADAKRDAERETAKALLRRRQSAQSVHLPGAVVPADDSIRQKLSRLDRVERETCMS